MNVQMGQELLSLKKGPLTQDHLRKYAETSGDFNPIHLDPEFAREAGYSSVIAHGMLSMAFIGDCIRKNFPEEKFQIQKFSARFKKVTFPGDELVVKGKIKATEPNGTLTVQLWTENQKGEITTQGECVLRNLAP